MSFKENLIRKTKIDSLENKINKSFFSTSEIVKIDKQSTLALLEMTSYEFIRKRDMDLYVSHKDPDNLKVLVLDNELPIYNTSVEDVALRKSPFIKEMVSIKNIIKILNDSDVVVSKKRETVAGLKKECLESLDFSYDESDIEAIEKDGRVSFVNAYTEGVMESLLLFAEILGYESAPRPFAISQHKIFGLLEQRENNQIFFGPVVMYGIIHNILKVIESSIGNYQKDEIERMHDTAAGKIKADIEGQDVFEYLKKKVIQEKGVSGTLVFNC